MGKLIVFMNSIMTAMLLTRGSSKSKIKTGEVNLSDQKVFVLKN